MSQPSKRILKRGEQYQYVLPKKGTILVSDMTREELMVALMNSMDSIQKISNQLDKASDLVNDWIEGRK